MAVTTATTGTGARSTSSRTMGIKTPAVAMRLIKEILLKPLLSSFHHRITEEMQQFDLSSDTNVWISLRSRHCNSYITKLQNSYETGGLCASVV